MLLHPGILALFLGHLLVAGLLTFAAWTGLRLAAGWDLHSSAEAQLLRERRTYLLSAVLPWALVFQILSLILLVHTLEKIHPLFTGAMCATGTLNAAPGGWTALGVKGLSAFAAALWLPLNRLDQRAEDYPLLRWKYQLLPFLALLTGLDLVLQTRFFLGLQPELVTSCCGSLFSTQGSRVAAGLAGLPPAPMMALFFGTALLLAVAAWLARRTIPARFALTLLALAWLPVALAAVISFIAPYWYQLPTHHCPFDLLQGHYGFIGYPLYLTLFAAAFFGLLPGLLQPLARFPSLRPGLGPAQQRWSLLALAAVIGCALIAAWPIVFGEFTLFGY